MLRARAPSKVPRGAEKLACKDHLCKPSLPVFASRTSRVGARPRCLRQDEASDCTDKASNFNPIFKRNTPNQIQENLKMKLSQVRSLLASLRRAFLKEKAR